MMWTSPNVENNFTIMGKCRIGHRNDILCVDNSSQYIVSGGIDGLLSIWNMMTGTLKYAVELPPPREVADIKNFDDQAEPFFSSKDDSIDKSESSESSNESFNIESPNRSFTRECKALIS
jgi:WD40 repeat protein